MNFPKAFEAALMQTITTHAQWTAQPRIRAWHGLSADAEWARTDDASYPLVDIRAKHPTTDLDSGYTQECVMSILIASHSDDDPSHDQLSGIYSSVSSVLDAIYSQFLSDVPGDERNTFDEVLTNSFPDESGVLSIGGFTFGEGLEPYEEGAMNFVGMSFSVHFSRSDF